MLEKVSYQEIPNPFGRRNANREFAERTVDEFRSLTCDGAKVTGWPIEGQSVANKVGHLKTAIKEKSLGSVMKAISRGEEVYLVRLRMV